MILPSDPAVRWRRLELLGWAFLLTYAFHPGPWGFLAWFSLVRPLWIFSGLSFRAALGGSYWFAFWFNLFSLYWVAMVTPPGMVAAVVIVAWYYTAILLVFHKLHSLRPWWGMVSIPFLWTGLEYIRTLSEFAFPWSDLGYTQSYYLYVLQIVSVISVHGLTWVIIAVNVLLWQLFRTGLSPERRLTSGLTAVATVALIVAYGWVVTPPYPEDGDIDVALLQGAVPLDVKWQQGNELHSLARYDSLAGTVNDSAALYIWPETSVPCYLTHSFGCRREVSATARRTNAYHLVGSLGATVEGDRTKYFNSCFMFGPSGDLEESFDKIKLVPFSEHVPYQDHVPFMQKQFLKEYLTFIDQAGVQWWSDFHPGDEPVLFEMPDASFGTLICFECGFPELVREYIQRGAEFMVGITNDTWFGESVGIHMHARMFITRAVENRCWMARAANSGFTFTVDPFGRIRSELDLGQVAALKTRVGRVDQFSFFVKHGDFIGHVSFLFTLSLSGILVALWLLRKLFSR